MTCIVGVQAEGRVWIGGDSAGSNEWTLQVRSDCKVFRVGPYVMGFTSSFRMGQLLRYGLRVGPPPGRDMDRFMSIDFIDAVRKTLADGGWLKTEDSREEGGHFLVGVRDRLYCIEGDFQVGHTYNGYSAVGSGDSVALGSLHTTESYRMTPRARLLAALTASSAHCPGVEPPFTILSTRVSG